MSTYVDEAFEEEGRVHGSASSLGVELHGGPRLGLVDNALVSVVVGVTEQGLPPIRKRGGVHSEPVVAVMTPVMAAT